MRKEGVILCLVIIIFLITPVYASKARADISISGEIKKSDINKLDNQESYNVIIRANTLDINSDKIKEFDHGNLISAELNKEEIESLVNKGLEVRLERTFTIDLSDSAKIINASMSWPIQVSSVNLTGINQTVCIIDTGVDYTHPDLGGCFGSNNPNSNCKVIGGYDFSNNDANPLDDHGHGTHVAGIVASNNSVYRGIAPEAKIIAIKSLNSAGSGSDSQIISGIEWCISNSSVFNINVISMSLGDSVNYTSYCNSDPLAASINAAVGKNISVIVASGNSGNYTGISSPACVQNSTAVGATTKSDTVASYSNRNHLLDFLAPGSNIASTYLSSSFKFLSGTSMSAPHAAAAFALVNQLVNLSNSNRKTPGEIERYFNLTSTLVYDSSSQRNYSRINVFSTLNLASYNYLNLSSPNNDFKTNINQSFHCNVSSILELSNLSFYLWNSTSLEYTATNNVSGKLNSSIFQYNFTHSDLYSWNCRAINNVSFSSFSEGNFTIQFDSTIPSLTINSPLNNSWTSVANFNITLSEEGLCTYSINKGQNNSMSTSNNLSFFDSNSTLIQDLRYNLTYFCNDTVGNSNFSDMIEFNVDHIKPNITVINPDDSYTATGETSIGFSFNVSDNLNISQCNLILSGSSVAQNSSEILSNQTNTIIHLISPGTYNWNINCTDQAGNTNSSVSRSLTINSVTVSGSSGGGGGGGGSSGFTYTPSQDSISGGYTKELGISDKVKFKFFDVQSKEHSLSVNDVGKDYVNLTVASSPINFKLGLGQSIKLNLTSKDYYDLYIKLDSINNKKAILTIQTIREQIFDNKVTTNTIQETDQNITENPPIQEIKEPKFETRIFLIIIILIILIILGVRLFYLKSLKKIESDILKKVEKDIKKKK